ncbi:MAG TPA: hypothetical protein VMP01_19905 [Pirellulaceae bacterium]|nr:hypothetical protein [Pirellulaceae bacterium]
MPLTAPIGLHVIGSGVGESIVVELPDGSIGVVDCCSKSLAGNSAEDRARANPTIAFLQRRFPNAQVAFLALTHLHEDHGKGFTQLIEELETRIQSIWICGGLNDTHVLQYFKQVAKHQKQLPGEEIFDEPPGTYARELLKLTRQVRQAAPATAFGVRRLCSTTQFHICNGEVAVDILGPRELRLLHFSESVQALLRDSIDPATRVVRSDWEPKSPKHNEVSPAIAITYGRTRLVLGGDMECNAWAEVVADTSTHVPPRSLACHVLKVSHHGSSNGYCQTLYQKLGGSRKFVAIVTPYFRGEHPLPEREGIQALLPFTSEIFVTDIERTREKLVDTQSAVSHRVSKSLSAAPEIRPYLSPTISLVQERTLAPTSMPHSIAKALRQDSAIKDVLDRSLIRKEPKPNFHRASDDHRVSLYFDRQGNELRRKREVGSKAGVLSPETLESSSNA